MDSVSVFNLVTLVIEQQLQAPRHAAADVRDESEVGGLPWPLRRVLELDERVARAAFRTNRLAPRFARARARMPRVNGRIGLDGLIDPDSWRLRVEGPLLHRLLPTTRAPGE